MRFAYDAAQCTGPWNCDLNFEKWLHSDFAKNWVNYGVTLGPQVGCEIFRIIVLPKKGALLQISDILQFISIICPEILVESDASNHPNLPWLSFQVTRDTATLLDATTLESFPFQPTRSTTRMPRNLVKLAHGIP